MPSSFRGPSGFRCSRRCARSNYSGRKRADVAQHPKLVRQRVVLPLVCVRRGCLVRCVKSQDHACGGSVSALAPPAPNEPLPATVCGGLARWKRYNRCWQLLPSSTFFPRQVASTCNTATFHTEVAQGRALFPCLTTPAPSPAGRPPPQKRRRSESPGTMSRCKEAGQQYPPWQYRSQTLGADRTPDAATRERVALLRGPVPSLLGFGAVPSLSQALSVSANSPCEWYPPVPDPTQGLKFHPDGSRPLVRAILLVWVGVRNQRARPCKGPPTILSSTSNGPWTWTFWTFFQSDLTLACSGFTTHSLCSASVAPVRVRGPCRPRPGTC